MKKIIKILSVVAFAITPFAVAITGIKLDSVSYATNSPDIKYSVKKKKENLIEIMSDGLDYRYLKDIIEYNEDFKDFAIIQQFANQGKKTNNSVPIIFGKYEKNNRWSLIRNNHLKKSDYSYYVDSHVFAHAAVEHLNELDKIVDFEKTILNPDNIRQEGKENGSSVGDPKGITNLDKNINVINWQQAKDKLTSNGWGFKTSFAGQLEYKYLEQFPKIAKSSEKPARLLFEDMITHFRYVQSPDYDVSLVNGNVPKTYRSLITYWKNYFNTLKKIKGTDGTSAYDNSMIVIYGDHGNHNSWNGTNKQGDQLHKEKSVLLIKYPHFSNLHNHPIHLNDRTVFGADVKHIIEDYFSNKNKYIDDKKIGKQNKVFDFINTNDNFDPDKLMINFEGSVMKFNKKHELINLGHDKDSDDPSFDPSKGNKYWGWS